MGHKQIDYTKLDTNNYGVIRITWLVGTQNLYKLVLNHIRSDQELQHFKLR